MSLGTSEEEVVSTVQDVVRTHAILTFLSRQPNASATLHELSTRFGATWQEVLNLLWDANLIEIPGMMTPFDLVLPDRPEQWDGTGQQPGQNSVVQLSTVGTGQVPHLNLALDEVMVLVALLDNVLEVTPPGESHRALRELRGSLARAATDAGFGQALWREPDSPLAVQSLETILSCIKEGREISFGYHRAGLNLREEVREVTAIPVAIATGASPTLRAVHEGRARTYRLDRIGRVTAGMVLGKQQVARARKLVSDEERQMRTTARAGRGHWVPDGESVTLHLTSAGTWAGETLPGAVTRQEGDTLVVTLNVTSDEWLFSLLLQLGDAVLAVHPKPVADRLAEHFARLLKETL